MGFTYSNTKLYPKINPLDILKVVKGNRSDGTCLQSWNVKVADESSGVQGQPWVRWLSGLEALGAELSNLSLIPGTHIIEREN